MTRTGGGSRSVVAAVAAAVVATTLGGASVAWAAPVQVVHVRADQQWVATGIDLVAGQTVRLQSQGSVRTAPFPVSHSGPAGQPFDCGSFDDNPCALLGAPYGALIGRVGDGAVELLGSSSTYTATSDGELLLGVNDNAFLLDDGTPCCYSDNVGQFVVIVRG